MFLRAICLGKQRLPLFCLLVMCVFKLSFSQPNNNKICIPFLACSLTFSKLKSQFRDTAYAQPVSQLLGWVQTCCSRMMLSTNPLETLLPWPDISKKVMAGNLSCYRTYHREVTFSLPTAGINSVLCPIKCRHHLCLCLTMFVPPSGIIRKC